MDLWRIGPWGIHPKLSCKRYMSLYYSECPISRLIDTYLIESATAKVKEAAGINAAKADGTAQEMAGTTKGTASEMAGQAQGKASEVAGQVQGKASELKGEAKGKAEEVKSKM